MVVYLRACVCVCARVSFFVWVVCFYICGCTCKEEIQDGMKFWQLQYHLLCLFSFLFPVIIFPPVCALKAHLHTRMSLLTFINNQVRVCLFLMRRWCLCSSCLGHTGHDLFAHPHHHRGWNCSSCGSRWWPHLEAVFRSLNYLVRVLPFKASGTQTEFRATDSLAEQQSTVAECLLMKIFIDPCLQLFGARLWNSKKARVFCDWNEIFGWLVLYFGCFILHKHRMVVFGRCFFFACDPEK